MPKLMSKETFDAISVMLESGEHSQVEIGKRVGVDVATVGKIKLGNHFYQADSKEKIRRKRSASQSYLPTPAEIRAACEEIRAAWKEEETLSWEPPAYPDFRLIPV